MAASDARPIPFKNTAYRLPLVIYNSSGDPATGASGLDSEVSIDGGSFADCTNEATEIAQGWYYLDLTSGEMNGDMVLIHVKSTSNKPTQVAIMPAENGDIRVDVVQISGDATAADNLEAALDGTGGVTISAGLTGNVTGNLSGSVGSVTSSVTVGTNNDKTGYRLSSTGVQDIWDALTSALSTVNSIGKLLVDNVNATISSRSNHTAANVRTEMDSNSTKLANLDATVSSRSTLTAAQVWDALTSGITTASSIGKLLVDNINATISSRLASASYSAPPSVASIRTEMDNNSTQLAKLDDTITSRLASASYTAPPSAGTIASTVWASGTRTLSSYGTLIADIWAYATRTLTSSGSGGATAQEVWEYGTRTLTSTAPPTATQIRQEMDSNSTKLANLDATVASRATPAQVNTEMLDVLNVDTFAEPSSVPAATSPLAAKLQWLFALARNKLTQNATTQSLRNDADSANIATSVVSDDGTTMTRGEWS